MDGDSHRHFLASKAACPTLRAATTTHLKQHAPAMLDNSTELHVGRYKYQGRSKATYLAHTGTHDFILSVYANSENASHRTPIAEQHAYMNYLRTGGLRVPNTIGSTFSVNGEVCELTEFLRGKQVKSLRKMSAAQVKNYASLLATIHRLGEGFNPTNQPVPFTIKSRGLPYGYVHGDLNPSNVLFDTSDNVAGVIDFEVCGQRILAKDIADLLKNSITATYDTKTGKLHATLDQNAVLFLMHYDQERSLSPRERNSIVHTLCDHAQTACYEANRDAGLPLRRERMHIEALSARHEFAKHMRTALQKEKAPTAPCIPKHMPPLSHPIAGVWGR